MHSGNGKAAVFVVWDGGDCRSETRDDDWEMSEIQRQMAAVAVVTVEERETRLQRKF